MIDRSISNSQQRISNLLRSPTAQPQAIAETILEESGLQTPKDKPMTSLSHAAGSLKTMLANLDQRSSEIAERSNRIERRAHVAFDKYHTVLDNQEAEVAALEDALNQQTNGGEE